MRSEVRAWAAALLGLCTALPALAQEELLLLDPSGVPVHVRPAEGETLLLHFWATWCASCVDDLAHLGELATRCGERVRILAVDAGDEADEVEAFVREHDVRLRVLRDPEGRAWRRLGGRELPMNVTWTRTGRVRDEGPMSREAWEVHLAALGCANAEATAESQASRR